MVEWDFHFYCKQFMKIKRIRKKHVFNFQMITVDKIENCLRWDKNKRNDSIYPTLVDIQLDMWLLNTWIILELFVCVKTRTSLHFANCVLVQVLHTFTVNVTTTDNRQLINAIKIENNKNDRVAKVLCEVLNISQRRVKNKFTWLTYIHIFNRLMVDGLR